MIVIDRAICLKFLFIFKAGVAAAAAMATRTTIAKVSVKRCGRI